MMKKILRQITRVSSKIVDLDSKLSKVSSDLNSKIARVSSDLDSKIAKVSSVLVDLDAYVHENMATKQELRETRDELLTHMDGFVQLHQIHDHELAAMMAKGERLDGRLTNVERHVGLGTS